MQKANRIGRKRQKEILEVLESGPATSDEIGSLLGCGGSNVSNHIRLLRHKGKVAIDHKDGNILYFRLVPNAQETEFAFLNPYPDKVNDAPSCQAPGLFLGGSVEEEAAPAPEAGSFDEIKGYAADVASSLACLINAVQRTETKVKDATADLAEVKAFMEKYLQPKGQP